MKSDIIARFSTRLRCNAAAVDDKKALVNNIYVKNVGGKIKKTLKTYNKRGRNNV